MNIEGNNLNFWQLLKQLDPKVLAALSVILLVTAVAYLPALQGEFTNWDDQIYVTANPMVTDFGPDKVNDLFTQQVGGNIHPLTMVSLILNYEVSGLEPFSYHLINLLFHLANTFLVFLFLYRLFPRSPWPGIITAMLFALHPLHVESVAWISERKDVLYTFFLLLGLINWFAFLKNKKRSTYLLVLLFFILSLLSKPAAVIFPLMLILIHYFEKRPFKTRFFLNLIPFILLAIGMGIITLMAQSEGGNVESQGFSILDKILLASYSFMIYGAKLVYPFELSAYYPFPDLNDLPFYYYAAPPLALTLGVVSLLLGRKNRIFPFTFLFFLINLVLVLQLLSIGNTLMADRYTYLASIGPFFLFAWGMHWLVEKYGMRLSFILAGSLILLGGSLAIHTWHRGQVWENSGTLWTDVIEKYPDIPLAYSNRGLYYSNSGQWEKTISDYQKSLALKPGYFDPQYNLGLAYNEIGDKKNAMIAFTRAISLRPNAAKAYNNRGNLYMDAGNLNMARVDYDKALEMRPGLVEAWVNRGLVGLRTSKLNRAMADLNEAIRRDPNLGHAYLVRSYIFKAQGNRNMARMDLDQAQRLGAEIDPDYQKDLQNN